MKRSVLLIVALTSICISKAQTWNEIQKIVASDRTSGSLYGWSISISGDYAVVGSYSQTDTNGSNYLGASGAAYIYKRNGETWTQIQKIVASDRHSPMRFGYSVAISGNWVAVGAFHNKTNGTGTNPLSQSGAVYMYKKNSSGAFIEYQKLVPSDREANDEFGQAVAISGNKLIVGADAESHTPPHNGHGVAYIFEYINLGIYWAWSEIQQIESSDNGPWELFGHAVSISGDYALVGSMNESLDENGLNSMLRAGAAYIFQCDNTTGNWSEIQKIVASDRGAHDGFGYSVAISNDRLIVGAILEDEDINGLNTKTSAGAAYIFERDNTTGIWSEVQKVVASDRDIDDEFGWAVSISSNVAVVGVRDEDEDELGSNTKDFAGSAYVYRRDFTGAWPQTQKIVSSDRQTSDLFGRSVSIDGNIIGVSANQEDHDENGMNALTNSGSAYLFRYCKNSGSELRDTACQSYISPSGNHIWDTSGMYLDTMVNYSGCDSLIAINLVVFTVDTTTYQSGDTIFASNQEASFQWVNCDSNYAIVPGATGQSFAPTSNGNYAVIITHDNYDCKDTSACHTLTPVSISKYLLGPIKVYPNPTMGHVKVFLQDNYSTLNVVIRTTTGQTILEKQFNGVSDAIIDLPPEKGLYILELLLDNDEIFYVKVVKH